MDSLSIICIVVGALVILKRGPLMFAPNATLRFYDRLFLSTNARVRAAGVVIATLAWLSSSPTLARGCWPDCSIPSDG